jgi:hypothetical protein
MPPLVVECLKCGLPRIVRGIELHALGAGHCPRCDYVGWASSHDLTEDERRALREVPVGFRRRARTRLARFA